MQQHPESTPSPAVAPPPVISPGNWESFQGFRETFLMHFPGAEVNAAFRTIATLVYDLILETPNLQPAPPEGYVRGHLRAAIADLRFLQGHLQGLAEETSPSPEDEPLCRAAGARSILLKRIADELEQHLGALPAAAEPPTQI